MGFWKKTANAGAKLAVVAGVGAGAYGAGQLKVDPHAADRSSMSFVDKTNNPKLHVDLDTATTEEYGGAALAAAGMVGAYATRDKKPKSPAK
jgi:hypothetical protein